MLYKSKTKNLGSIDFLLHAHRFIRLLRKALLQCYSCFFPPFFRKGLVQNVVYACMHAILMSTHVYSRACMYGCVRTRASTQRHTVKTSYHT